MDRNQMCGGCEAACSYTSSARSDDITGRACLSSKFLALVQRLTAGGVGQSPDIPSQSVAGLNRCPALPAIYGSFPPGLVAPRRRAWDPRTPPRPRCSSQRMRIETVSAATVLFHRFVRPFRPRKPNRSSIGGRNAGPEWGSLSEIAKHRKLNESTFSSAHHGLLRCRDAQGPSSNGHSEPPGCPQRSGRETRVHILHAGVHTAYSPHCGAPHAYTLLPLRDEYGIWHAITPDGHVQPRAGS